MTKSDTHHKENLIQYYQWLRKYGLNDSHSGNASIRIDDRIWVTPSGACADTLSPNDLVMCTIDGNCSDGASLDAPLHVQIYQRNPQARAVLHSHNPHTLAITMDGIDFEPVDFEGSYYFDKVPVLDIPYARYVEDAPEKVGQCLAEKRICVVRGHGIYTCADSLNLAYKWTCSLELSAKIAYLNRMLNH